VKDLLIVALAFLVGLAAIEGFERGYQAGLARAEDPRRPLGD